MGRSLGARTSDEERGVFFFEQCCARHYNCGSHEAVQAMRREEEGGYVCHHE